MKSPAIYGIHKTPFGKCVIGILDQGVCYLSFVDKENASKIQKDISKEWPQTKFVRNDVKTKKYIDRIFKSRKPVVIVMKGTDFQKRVWDALCEIPHGHTTSYADIASAVGLPKAVRAVGTACGQNIIGFLIPCHRVLPSNGKLGGYKWGIERKKKILEWEQMRK